MKTSIILIFFIVLCFHSRFVNGATYSYNDPHFKYHGRYFIDSQGVRYDWPCFTI
jgi:hypothetical protein